MPVISVTCEVCLEDMSGLDSIAELQGEESRAMLRARAALLRVNGEDPRDHGGEADPTFDDTDPREGRICWGSRNPLVWLVWLVTRPIIGVVWVSLPARIRPPRSLPRRGEYRTDTALAAFPPILLSVAIQSLASGGCTLVIYRHDFNVLGSRPVDDV